MIHNVEFITNFIFVENEITPCDVILVPGGSHSRLAEKAAELYNQGMAKCILFSGHANPNLPDYSSEAEWLKSVAINSGVPSASVICENEAANTFENAMFSLSLLEKMKFNTDKFILVCKAYHSRRALITYQNVFRQKTEFFVSTIEDKHGLNKNNWTTKNEHIAKVMGEVEKIGKYFKDKIAISRS